MARKFLLFVVICALSLAAASVSPAAVVPASEVPGPIATAAAAYANALAAGSLGQAWQMLSSQSKAEISVVEWQEAFRQTARARKPPPTALLRAIAESGAPLVGDVLAGPEEALIEVKGAVEIPLKLILVKEAGEWKVDAAASDQMNSRQAAVDFLEAVRAEAAPSGPRMLTPSQAVSMEVLRALLAPEARRYEVTGAEVEGERAEVSLAAEIPVNLVLRAARSGPGWLVDLSRPLVPVDTSSRDPLREAMAVSDQTDCENQLRQLARAIQMYAASSADMVPDPARWLDQVKPYVPQPAQLHCPRDAEPGLSYAMNANLAGKRLHQISNPSLTVLLFESTSHAANAADKGESWPTHARHPGGYLVAFADGSVRLVAAKPGFDVTEGPAGGRQGVVVPGRAPQRRPPAPRPPGVRVPGR